MVTAAEMFLSLPRGQYWNNISPTNTTNHGLDISPVVSRSVWSNVKKSIEVGCIAKILAGVQGLPASDPESGQDLLAKSPVGQGPGAVATYRHKISFNSSKISLSGDGPDSIRSSGSGITPQHYLEFRTMNFISDANKSWVIQSHYYSSSGAPGFEKSCVKI